MPSTGDMFHSYLNNFLTITISMRERGQKGTPWDPLAENDNVRKGSMDRECGEK
jgi:hypothetical protein